MSRQAKPRLPDELWDRITITRDPPTKDAMVHVNDAQRPYFIVAFGANGDPRGRGQQ